MKTCSKCKIEKDYSKFVKCKQSKDGHYSSCKSCVKLYYTQNKEKIAKYKKKYRKDNKKQLAKYAKEYKKKNKESINLRIKTRKKIDIKFKLASNLRSRLNNAIRSNQKSGSTVKDLGCSIEELKLHLESQFQEGMTWDNWTINGWHIDHINPLSSFDLTNREQFLEACHFSNLQPLWSFDNLSKGAKVEEDDKCKLIIDSNNNCI